MFKGIQKKHKQTQDLAVGDGNLKAKPLGKRFISPKESDQRQPPTFQENQVLNPLGPVNITSQPAPPPGFYIDMLNKRQQFNVFNQRKNEVMSCSNAPSSEYDN